MIYNCAICFDNFEEEKLIYKFCNDKHIFCKKCFQEYVNKIHKDKPKMPVYETIPCPYCRTNISAQYLYAINGKKEGLNKVYYKSGRLYEEVYYKDGYIGDGPYKKYYNSGISGENLWISYTYFNNKINGIYIENHENGNIKRKSFYKNGKINGYSCRYYHNNILECEGYYIDDMCEGFYKEYYQNGKLKRSTTYVNGNRNGLNEEYNIEGELVKKEFYKNGVKIEDFYFG